MKALGWWFISIMLLATAGVSIAVSRHQRGPERTFGDKHFYVRGEVRAVNSQAKTIRIKHEEIPNYMPAMIMPFDVRDAAVLRGVSAGDEVGFELVVTKDDSWIASIQRLSESAPIASAETANEVQRLQPGEIVPNLSLTNQNGRAVQLKDFRGRAVLLTFIYTRCPLPNFCPLMSKNFASLQQRLQKDRPGKFQLMSVTIDPDFDQPEVLKDYAARQGADESTWTFATGSAEQIDAVASLFGLVHERAGGLINHDLRTALIGPDGKLVHVWKSNFWTPYEVQRRVEEILPQANSASAR
jgi:protein SCO1/2